MTREDLITAPDGTDLKKAESILTKYKIEKLPVVNKSGKSDWTDHLPRYFTIVQSSQCR